MTNLTLILLRKFGLWKAARRRYTACDAVYTCKHEDTLSFSASTRITHAQSPRLCSSARPLLHITEAPTSRLRLLKLLHQPVTEGGD